MPLFKGSKNVGRNISTLQGEGKKRDQAIAIALSIAGKARPKKAEGGKIREPNTGFETDIEDPNKPGPSAPISTEASRWRTYFGTRPLQRSMFPGLSTYLLDRQRLYDQQKKASGGRVGYETGGAPKTREQIRQEVRDDPMGTLRRMPEEIDATFTHPRALDRPWSMPTAWAPAWARVLNEVVRMGAEPKKAEGGRVGFAPGGAALVPTDETSGIPFSDNRQQWLADKYMDDQKKWGSTPSPRASHWAPWLRDIIRKAPLPPDWATTPEAAEELKGRIDNPRTRTKRAYAEGGMTHPRDPAIDTALRLARGGFAGGGELRGAELDMSPADVAPMPRTGSLSSIYDWLEGKAKSAHEGIDASIPKEIDFRPHAYPLLAHSAVGLGLDLPASATRLASKGIDYFRGQPEATEVRPEDLGILAPVVGSRAKAMAEPVRNALAAIPKSARAATAGGAGLVALPSEGTPQSAATGDPRRAEIDALRKQIDKNNEIIRGLGKEMYRGKPEEASASRMLAARPYEQANERAEKRITTLQAEMTGAESRKLDAAIAARDKVLNEAPQPFHKSMVGQYVAPAIPWLPMLAGAYTGYKLTGPKARAEHGQLQKWNEALEKASTPQRSPVNKELEVNVAKNIEGAWPESGFFSKAASAYPTAAGLSAIEGGIIPNLMPAYNSMWLDEENPERKSTQEFVKQAPEGHPDTLRALRMLENENVLPKGNPALASARNYFTDWRNQMVPRSAAGALEAVAGSIPTTTAGIVAAPWEKSLPRARTQALVDQLNQTRLSPAPARSGTPKALPAPAAEAPAVSATPLPAAPVAPRLLAPTAEAAPSAPAAPKTTSASEASDLMKVKTKDGRVTWHGPDGRYNSPPNKTTTASSTTGKGNGAGTPRDEIAPGVPRKPEKPFDPEDPINRGHKHGGSVVSGALEIARRYAHGGKVGALNSPVPGRTDHLPLTVPEGAFVWPADVVSGRGQGNTAAGQKFFDRLEAHVRKSGGGATMARGGSAMAKPRKVDIMAAGGERISPPEVVCALGNGDMEHGHRVCEALLKKFRAEDVRTISNLPGPSR